MTTIGKTNISAYPIAFGAMELSISGRPEYQQAKDVISAFIELGGNFIDTANAYCIDESEIGHNEKLIAQALNELGAKDIFVATKGGCTRNGREWARDGRPQSIRAACEASLRALGTDAIFLYQYHAIDPQVPFEETVGEFQRLRDEGKVQHVGLSNVSVEQIQIAEGMVPITSVQNKCNLIHQADFENEVIAYCEKNEITYLPWRPVAGFKDHDFSLADCDVLQDLARTHNVTAHAIAIAWHLHKSKCSLPIPGTKNLEHLKANMLAANVRLSENEIKLIDTVKT